MLACLLLFLVKRARESGGGQAPKVVLTIPFPDSRSRNWGTVGGHALDMGKEPDQVAAVKWYIDLAMSKVAALKLTHASHIGFYWFNEDIQRGDYPLVKAVAAYIHTLTTKQVSLPSGSNVILLRRSLFPSDS